MLDCWVVRSGYDANGNQTGLSYYGSLFAFTFDEDRLTAVTGPKGINGSFAYNGLGQRVAKTDSTGTYTLGSDGAALTEGPPKTFLYADLAAPRKWGGEIAPASLLLRLSTFCA